MSYTYDGQTYQDHEEHIDIGSWVCVDASQEQTTDKLYVRNYMGKSADISKLPKYPSLATGSSALCIDTGDVLFYDATTQTWTELD